MLDMSFDNILPPCDPPRLKREVEEYPTRPGVPSMSSERWEALMRFEDGVDLSMEERSLGWHFCTEWDGLLIGPGMDECKYCLCERKP